MFLGGDKAVEEADSPLGIEGYVCIMGDHDNRETALAIEFAEQFHDLATRCRIKVARRLVRQQQGGLDHHGACNCHPLLLPAGKLKRVYAFPSP